EQNRRDEQQRGDRLGGSRRELTAGNRTSTLDRVRSVMFRVADVVDEVARARGRAVRAEGGQRFAPAREVAELRGEDDPGEEEEVLRPLAGAERNDRGLELRAAARKVEDGSRLRMCQRELETSRVRRRDGSRAGRRPARTGTSLHRPPTRRHASAGRCDGGAPFA